MHSFFIKNNSEKAMFSGFFSIYLDQFDSKFSNENKVYFNGIYTYLYNSMFNFSIRSLIKELYNYKCNNLLIGNTSEERYLYFEKITESKSFQNELYNKYPVLKIYFEKKINQTVSYVNEIISCFEKDKNNLEKIFNMKFEKILDIHLGKGDDHNNGKSVAIIECNCGKIVYKPHNLLSDIVLKSIIDWINSKKVLKCTLNSLRVLTHENYGWQEFITYKECESSDQIENYYYRAGCFLAIFYTLGTTDIHYENVIANGEYPYFIDLETLFTIGNPGQLDTVLSTAFIPNRSINSLIDIDLSGLCGKGQLSSKLTTIGIINPKTDEMRIENKQAQVFSSNNLVKINGKTVNVGDYVDKFIEGFESIIDLIINNKISYLDLINSKVKQEEKFRQVIRFTHVYAKFLIAATHPDYLVSEKKRLELFNRLYNGCNNELDRIRIANEIQNLLNWNIPYYYCYYNSKDLFSNNEIIGKDFYSTTIKDSLNERIMNIDNKVKNYQIDIIKKSLFTVYNNELTNKKVSKLTLCRNKKSNKDIIMEISNSISSNIIEMKDDKTASLWINSIYNGKFILSPINFHLYEGGGIIWLFACLGKLYNDDYYKRISTKLLETSVLTYEYFESTQISYKGRISAFFGIGSLMYLYYNMYILYDDEKYKIKYMNIIKKILEYDLSYLKLDSNSENYDFLCGISGLLVLASKIYINNNDDTLKELIYKYSNYLVSYINNNNIEKIGLAHGISGYSLALIMIYRVTNDKYYLNLANELINKEDIIYRKNIDVNEVKTSWCNGETGMLLARYELFKLTLDQDILDTINKYLNIVSTIGFYNINNMCLCHGIYGNMEVVSKVINDIKETQSIITSESIKKIEKSLICDISDIQLGLKNNFVIDTFMIGSSGIAYSKLRNKYPILPSILCLDILDKNKF